MDDREAIDIYDRAGTRRAGANSGVRWPHVALDAENLARLAVGVIESRIDPARLAFGDDFDARKWGERLSEAWRTDALTTRFAPEGVFVRAQMSVRFEIEPADEDGDDEEAVAHTLAFDVELCLSFTEKNHVRPFVDFMHGTARRMDDDVVTRLDPFGVLVTPGDAVGWGLNGCEA